MATFRQRFRNSEFRSIFHCGSPEGRGACLLLGNAIVANLAGAITGGVFYISFMAQNGIDIVRIGILGSIPSLCWLLSLLTPKIMRHFRSRRWVLLGAHLFNVSCTILGTTVMPYFVQDYTARTIWFGVFLLLGNLASALFNSGATAWHLHFVPESDHGRNIYYSYHNIIGLLTSTLTNLVVAYVADSLAGTPEEAQIISTLRLCAFGLQILCGILCYVLPKEYPYEHSTQETRISDVFRLPFKEKKFLLTACVIFLWTIMTNCNSNTWNYYLMETAGISYLALQGSVICQVLSNFLLLPWFRRLSAKYSMPAMLRVGILGMALSQLSLSFIAPGRTVYFLLTQIPNGIFWSLLNLCTANAFVYNLPPKDRDVYTVFWNLMSHVAVVIGANLGAWYLSVLGDGVVFNLFNTDFYSSQVLMITKFGINTCLSLLVAFLTPKIRHAKETL